MTLISTLTRYIIIFFFLLVILLIVLGGIAYYLLKIRKITSREEQFDYSNIDLFKLISTNLKNIAVKKGNISLALDNHLIQSNISINNSNEQLEESYESNLLKIGRGNLIGLNCGHNGALNSVEERTLIYHIENSGFVSIPNNNII